MDKVAQLYQQVIADMILTMVPDLFAELGDPADRLPKVRGMAFTQDRNNLQVANVLIDWIEHHVETKDFARR